MKWVLMALTVSFTSALMAPVPASAQEERGSSFYCMAEDRSSNTYVHSGTFKADPGVSSEAYEASWKAYLRGNGMPDRGGCTFTDLPENVPEYLNGLKQQCDTCSVWSLRAVDWRYSPVARAKPTNLAAEICEPLAYTEANYRELSLAEGKDQQLRVFCGQSYEYWTMYKRALSQGYSEADAGRTYAAHEKAALVLRQFYEETRTDR